MPIDTRDWYREKKHDYKPPHETWKSYRYPKRKPPLARIFVVFLLVACVVATAYTGYLLFTHQTNWIVGAIVFAADIGVLFWNISAFRKWRIGARTLVPIFLVIAFLGATACAFGGVAPFSSAKNEVVSWFQNIGSQGGGTQPSPPSTYPAEINGHVTIAEKVRAELPKSQKQIEWMPLGNDRGWWIVEVSVKNKDYEKPITAIWNSSLSMPIGEEHWIWSIMIDDKVWTGLKNVDIFTPASMSVSKGQSGSTTFLFKAPNIEPSDAQICYRGQEPYSYGKLTAGDKVVVYDWDLKKAVEEITDSRELYVVPNEHLQTSTKRLRTIARWTGTESRVISFSIEKSPWVINGIYDVVSSLGHNFEYLIFTEDEYSVPEDALWKMWEHELLMPTRFVAGDHYLVKQSGKFVICVYASGVEWELRVGVE